MLSIYKFFVSRGQTFSFLLGLVVVVIVVATAISGIGSAGYDMGTDLNEVLKNNSEETFDFFNAAVWLPVIMIGFIILLIALFSVSNLVSDPKGSLKSIIGLAVLLILFFILYSMAVPETAGRIGMLHDKFDISDGVSRFISGGIWTTLILIGGAAVLMVISSIINIFK